MRRLFNTALAVKKKLSSARTYEAVEAFILQNFKGFSAFIKESQLEDIPWPGFLQLNQTRSALQNSSILDKPLSQTKPGIFDFNAVVAVLVVETREERLYKISKRVRKPKPSLEKMSI